MACIRKRRGTWVVDYRDANSVRRWETFATKQAAEDRLAEILPETRQKVRPTVEPNITLTDYAGRWLSRIAATVKPRTLDSYAKTLRLHLLPTLGRAQVRQLSRGAIKDLLAAKLTAGLARDSVRIIQATLRALLNEAIEDGLLRANPAAKLGRKLKLIQSTATRQEEIKAMTQEQIERFLTAAATDPPARRYAPLFLTLARAGMRIGEGLALQWEDLHFAAREIRVSRAFSAGRLDTPKSGHGRTVDMSQGLAQALLALQTHREAEAAYAGREPTPWVFLNEAGAPLDESKVRRVFARVLRLAGLPRHFSPHSLRHSFASILLSDGVSPAYVQRMLGHASIKLTVDTYGKWLPIGNKAAVDRLDEASGSRVVAETAAGREERPQVGLPVEDKSAGLRGGPWRTRTSDPLIKSQLLYQLS